MQLAASGLIHLAVGEHDLDPIGGQGFSQGHAAER
jgi:hypothetical protein